MKKNLILFSDGGARGNPGPAGIGVVIYDENHKELVQISKYIGEATNNQAEYLALLEGLKKSQELGAAKVSCFLDSELIVKQLKGEYKVKNVELGKIYIKIWNLMQGLEKVTFKHVKREKNKVADLLVNQALDKHLKKKS